MNRFLEFVKLSDAEEIKGFTNNFYRLKELMHDGDQLIVAAIQSRSTLP